MRQNVKSKCLFASLTSGWVSCGWGDVAWLDRGDGTPHEQLHVAAVQASGPQVQNSYDYYSLLSTVRDEQAMQMPEDPASLVIAMKIKIFSKVTIFSLQGQQQEGGLLKGIFS